MAYYHRFLGKLSSYHHPPVPTQLFFFTFFFENMLSLNRWHSMPNNLSNHSTDQITWEGYSNNNLDFLFEKTQSWDNSCYTSTSIGFPPTHCFYYVKKNPNFSLCMYSHYGFYQNPIYITEIDNLCYFKVGGGGSCLNTWGTSLIAIKYSRLIFFNL